MKQIKLLRFTGISEGISFLVLLLIAMPLKYYFGLPMAVKMIGWAHGVLFIAYLMAVSLSIRVMNWNFWKVVVAVIGSLLPFGTFILDKSWKRRQAELQCGN